jgi:hypothetical protein
MLTRETVVRVVCLCCGVIKFYSPNDPSIPEVCPSCNDGKPYTWYGKLNEHGKSK